MLTRSEIRDKIRDGLINKTLAGENVFSTRFLPVSNIPAVVIYATNEAVRVVNESPREYERSLTLIIEGLIDVDLGRENADFKIDLLEQQIESYMNDDYDLDGLAMNHELESVEFSMDSESETAIGILKMQYKVLYMTDGLNEKNYDYIDRIGLSIGVNGQLMEGEVRYDKD